MTNYVNEEIILYKISELMIPSERVAHVQLGNNLEHALLVLTKSGYSAIPVLDPHYKLHGLISTPIIMDSILGLERIEFEKLQKKKVEEVMNKTIPCVKINTTMVHSLDLLVDNPFICIENDNGIFEGILTRRSILQLLSNQIRMIDHRNKKK